jgi:hypothetical protein
MHTFYISFSRSWDGRRFLEIFGDFWQATCPKFVAVPRGAKKQLTNLLIVEQ